MSVQTATRTGSLQNFSLSVLAALSISHFLNDLIQSLLPSIYPILQKDFALSYAQIGLITFVFQITASLLQPFIGAKTDKNPKPYSFVFGMGCSLAGLLILSRAHVFGVVLAAAMVIGVGSAVFHPEASRVARLASGGRFGFAQSFFQVGGNSGQALSSLLAALIISPYGQGAVGYFGLAAVLAIGLLIYVGRWYSEHLQQQSKAKVSPAPMTRRQIAAISILLTLVFSKNFYIASLQSFYTFYLIKKFGVTIEASQIYLFVFMGAIALGTFFGGPLCDRFGRIPILWISVVGVLPLTLAAPYVGFWGTVILTAVIGFIMSWSFSALVVHAQEFAPGRVGLIGGLFFGLSFGAGGLGAALLGILADHTSLEFVYAVSSFLPAVGLLMFFMPKPQVTADPPL